MKNRTVGMLLVGLAILIGFIALSFHLSLGRIAASSCTDIIQGTSCPIVESNKFQTKLVLALGGAVVLFGLYLFFFGEEGKERREPSQKEITEKHAKNPSEKYQQILSILDNEEKQIFEKILSANGSIYQSELAHGQNLTKVKVTRILDKLEGRGLIERKRRGMTNVVVLKPL